MPIQIDAARLKTTAIDRVFVVECRGLLTAQTVRNIRRWVPGVLPPDAGAVVLDYRACVIAITDTELQALATPTKPLSPPIPLAWVVADEATAELWRRQVLRLALAGQRRFVSCLPEVGYAWAAEQARLAQSAAPR